MTTEPGWGNPAGSTFQRRFTRLVAVDELRVRVHKDLAVIVEKLLHDMSTQDLVVDRLEGFPEVPDGTGLIIRVRGMDPDTTAGAMAGYGFSLTTDTEDVYLWGGSHVEAIAKSRDLDAAAHAAPDADDDGTDDTGEQADEADAAQEPQTPPVAAEIDREDPLWFDGRPGDRELTAGGNQRGRDVLFLQAYLDVPRTGLYDVETIAAVNYFRGRRGLPEGGLMDRESWQQFLPRLRSALFPGATGRAVRILAAAMVAHGDIPIQDPVSGRYNGKMLREVREMQTANGFRRTGRIATAEWSLLIAHPWGA